MLTTPPTRSPLGTPIGIFTLVWSGLNQNFQSPDDARPDQRLRAESNRAVVLERRRDFSVDHIQVASAVHIEFLGLDPNKLPDVPPEGRPKLSMCPVGKEQAPKIKDVWPPGPLMNGNSILHQDQNADSALGVLGRARWGGIYGLSSGSCRRSVA